MKLNKPIIGFLLGLVLPVLGDIIVYFILFKGQMSFSEYIGMFGKMFSTYHDPLLPKAMSLSMIMQLVPFIYFTNKHYDLGARGVFSATILWAVLIVLIRFVW
jgi:uncharacterized membrane protein YjjP (DUF1212 family)